MKKVFLTLLLAAGLVLVGQVSATAQALPRAQDTDGYCAIIWQYAHAGLPAAFLSLDNAADGIPDADQYALLCAVLADGSSPSHATAIAVWNHNFAAAVQDIIPALPPDDGGTYPFRAGLAMMMCTGSAGDVTDCVTILAILQASGFPVNAAAFNPADYQSLSSLLPGGADPDTDGLTNKAEYDAIAGTGGPGAKRDQWIVDVQAASGPTTLTATASGGAWRNEVGQTVTLTATAAGGTAPYTYQWLKNGVIINGATSSTLVLGPLTLANSGAYSVRVRDDENALAESEAVTVTVLAEGSLPVAGIAGLGLLAAACVAFGVRKAIKK